MPSTLSALTSDTVEKLAVGMLVVIAVIAVLIIRSSLKLASKLVVIVVLGSIGVALFQNRVELGKCSQTCECAIYGHDVSVPHLPFACDY
ncbi:MAG TPA: hypothetical protein VGZ52_01830 [Acidimicrobiales bacterium]|jgi:hypothetical protein|nr:hypothetical protein [Acidimicrobiales bacterium]